MMVMMLMLLLLLLLAWPGSPSSYFVIGRCVWSPICFKCGWLTFRDQVIVIWFIVFEFWWWLSWRWSRWWWWWWWWWWIGNTISTSFRRRLTLIAMRAEKTRQFQQKKPWYVTRWQGGHGKMGISFLGDLFAFFGRFVCLFWHCSLVRKISCIVHCCRLEIDAYIGKVKILRLWS